MGSSAQFDDEEPISEINIVPFVDIILVVLIIFMVTTPFILKPSIPIKLPKGASGDKTAPSKFQISLQTNGEVKLNGKVVTLEQLKSLAVVFLKENPTGQALLSADKKVPHGEVVTVMDTIKSSGIQRIGISIDSI